MPNAESHFSSATHGLQTKLRCVARSAYQGKQAVLLQRNEWHKSWRGYGRSTGTRLLELKVLPLMADLCICIPASMSKEVSCRRCQWDKQPGSPACKSTHGHWPCSRFSLKPPIVSSLYSSFSNVYNTSVLTFTSLSHLTCWTLGCSLWHWLLGQILVDLCCHLRFNHWQISVVYSLFNSMYTLLRFLGEFSLGSPAVANTLPLCQPA